jgi:hypothetical protein
VHQVSELWKLRRDAEPLASSDGFDEADLVLGVTKFGDGAGLS